MRYGKSLEDFILSLKGGVFFLSPREKLFLAFLDEMGLPEDVLREGVEDCYRAVDPRKRSRYPLFLCMRPIMEAYERFLRLEAQKGGLDWKRRFQKKLALAKKYLKTGAVEPASEEEAHKLLKELERRIVRKLWRSMDEEEKRRIKEKYREFERNRSLYSELIKEEVKRIHGVPNLSLYVD